MIPQEEWLHIAKRLAVGQKRRVVHSCGRTAAMDVYNSGDCWSAHCFRCKETGWVPKEHQQLRSQVQEDPTRVSPVPADALHLSQTSAFVQRRIWDLLIQKGCPPGIIPEEFVWYSQSVNRLLLRSGSRALGRALSTQQLPKWMGYSDTPVLQKLWFTRYLMNQSIVLTEDALSAYKVAKAASVYALPVDVAATLGTSLTPSSLRMVVDNYSTVVVAYDGDSAGHAGLVAIKQRLNVFGVRTLDARPETGDPKDLPLEVLNETIRGVLSSISR